MRFCSETLFYKPLVPSTVFETSFLLCSTICTSSSNCFTHMIPKHYSNFHKQQETSACHWILPCPLCYLCKSLSLVIATWFPLHSCVEIPDSQTHGGLLQKYNENQWRNFWIWTLIFLLSDHKPKNLIWLSKLTMELTLIMQRKIRSQPFFSVTAFILEDVTAAGKDVEFSLVPISKSILVQIPGWRFRALWHYPEPPPLGHFVLGWYLFS